ncbi:hypothetical protein ACN38_g12578, partial [Penicillium nordicum]
CLLFAICCLLQLSNAQVVCRVYKPLHY